MVSPCSKYSSGEKQKKHSNFNNDFQIMGKRNSDSSTHYEDVTKDELNFHLAAKNDLDHRMSFGVILLI